MRSDVIIPRSCVFGLLDLVTGSLSAGNDFLLLLQHFFGHFVHVVAVDFCEMGRCSVLKSIDG